MSRRQHLVDAAVRGDRDAFAELLEEEVGTAYRVARVVVDSDASAQDAVQDACIRAWRDLPGLRDAEKWPAWFRRIVVRSASDQARRDVRGRRAIAHEFPAVLPDPSEHLARRDSVARALAGLSAQERMLIGLRFVADLEVPDLADALGIPLGTAKSRLHRALAKLRAALEASDE